MKSFYKSYMSNDTLKYPSLYSITSAPSLFCVFLLLLYMLCHGWMDCSYPFWLTGARKDPCALMPSIDVRRCPSSVVVNYFKKISPLKLLDQIPSNFH